MSRAYYNEIDPYAAQWLRNLIAEGLIADGDVDERSIEDVAPNDLKGYTQCHFFAGLGGWSYALRLAGIPDDYPVWTGSCPCQPFSAAGKGAGFADERHLWPAFHWLIEQCRPVAVMGEQVASRDGLAWLDLVSTDLEGAGYAVRAADLGAAGVGAPHIRQRLYWVGYANGIRRDERRRAEGASLQGQCAERSGKHAQSEQSRKLSWRSEGLGGAGRMADSDGGKSRQSGSIQPSGEHGQQSQNGGDGRSQHRGSQPHATRHLGANATDSFWRDADWLFCRDGKWRPVEPGLKPLAHGLPQAVDGLGPISRVGALRGFGNAIVPQVAAAFIASVITDL